MKYTVKITKSGEADILTSFRWGVRNWGVGQAKKWATDLRRSIKEQLSHFPNGCPLAPDRDLDANDVRHLIVGRYRVLFEIEGNMVRVLRVRGAYFEEGAEDL
jgi:plasmid stabilization system protein ParE